MGQCIILLVITNAAFKQHQNEINSRNDNEVFKSRLNAQTDGVILIEKKDSQNILLFANKAAISLFELAMKKEEF